MMNRGTALAKLRRHAPELRAEGIVALYLCGSTARNEARKASDIDLFFDAFRMSCRQTRGSAAIRTRGWRTPRFAP
jgi:predicted nucleotidyltransferase